MRPNGKRVERLRYGRARLIETAPMYELERKATTPGEIHKDEIREVMK